MRFLTGVRALLFFPYVLVLTFGLTLVMAVFWLVGAKSFVLKITDLWCRLLFSFIGVQVEYKGLEKLRGLEAGGVLVFNHSSLMDVPAIQQMPIEHQICFGAKAELFRIPVFAQALHMMGVLPIARKDRSKVLNLYKKSIEKLKEKVFFALAPEGTRGNGAEIQPFKSGPFIFAIQAQAPVVCAFLQGAGEVLPNGNLWTNIGQWKRIITVEIIHIEPTQGLGEEQDRKPLQKKVEQIYRRHQEGLISSS